MLRVYLIQRRRLYEHLFRLLLLWCGSEREHLLLKTSRYALTVFLFALYSNTTYTTVFARNQCRSAPSVWVDNGFDAPTVNGGILFG